MVKNIWTNGCFDILHVGHIRMFKYAASLGDRLYVGIDSDEKVKQEKGDDRPFNTLSDRIEMLLSIRHITGVIPFDSPEGLENEIKKLNPDAMVIGKDWEGKHIVGGQYAKKIIFFDRIPNYSTTKILEWKKLQ